MFVADALSKCPHRLSITAVPACAAFAGSVHVGLLPWNGEIIPPGSIPNPYTSIPPLPAGG